MLYAQTFMFHLVKEAATEQQVFRRISNERQLVKNDQISSLISGTDSSMDDLVCIAFYIPYLENFLYHYDI